MNEVYVRTVQLLLDVAPAVFANPAFAMKGGTALNLFVQNMPRLSVDIDVVFTRHEMTRHEALAAITAELTAVRERIEAMGYAVSMPRSDEGGEAKLFVRAADVVVKIEVNFVFRGTVLPVVQCDLVPAAQRQFAANIKLPILATPELYASKLVATMDRQHPRDLFDVQLMLDSGRTWNDDMLDCFVVYLAGHNRPMHEVLFPNMKPLKAVFENEFEGMAAGPVDLQNLANVRSQLLQELPKALRPRHREFLLSMARAEPDWTLLAHPHVRELPALQWKLMNLAKLRKNSKKFAMQHDELAARLGLLQS